MVIFQVLPRLPPAIDGVGDYALNLARQLRQDFGRGTHFVVGDPHWSGRVPVEGFSASQVIEQSAIAFLAQLPSDSSATVLLHYVGYGYAKRGSPFWLVEGLQRWRAAEKQRILITMFHELYAFGPPWTSAFWLSPLQKNLVKRLATISDRCLTNKQGYAETLQTFSRGKHPHIVALPVFSNVGEHLTAPPLAERERRLVVFGSRSSRIRVYRESAEKLSYACKHLEIENILDIGPATELALSKIDNVPVVELGELSAEKVSRILLNSIAGFLDYNPDFFAKSTIFAAYCAHRMLPINARGSNLLEDGIETGRHYWMPDPQHRGDEDGVELQAIADNARAWYQPHNLAVQAKEFFAHLHV
jgi:hypothetical protein